MNLNLNPTAKRAPANLNELGCITNYQKLPAERFEKFPDGSRRVLQPNITEGLPIMLSDLKFVFYFLLFSNFGHFIDISEFSEF